MANYTENFTSVTGSTIVASELETEFDAISTAIATKLDQYSGATADTTLGATDVISIYDGAYKKMTVANARFAMSGFNDTGFWAKMTSNQTGLATGTSTVLVFSTTGEVDNATAFVPATGIYTAPSTGYYIFHARSATVTAITTGKYHNMLFTTSANGNIGLSSNISYVGSAKTTSCHAVVHLTAADTITAKFYHDIGSDVVIDGVNGNGLTYFTGWRFA